VAGGSPTGAIVADASIALSPSSDALLSSSFAGVFVAGLASGERIDGGVFVIPSPRRFGLEGWGAASGEPAGRAALDPELTWNPSSLLTSWMLPPRMVR